MVYFEIIVYCNAVPRKQTLVSILINHNHVAICHESKRHSLSRIFSNSKFGPFQHKKSPVITTGLG